MNLYINKNSWKMMSNIKIFRKKRDKHICLSDGLFSVDLDTIELLK